MSQVRAWSMRLAGLFGRRERDEELARELESHLQLHIDDNLRSGMTPEAARRAALLKLGGVEAVKESYRERRGVPVIEHLWQDARYGVRVLAKNPSFTVAAVLALALGIGANTALFSAVYGVLLRPLPYADGDRLVIVRQQALARGIEQMGFSVKEIEDYRAQAQTLDDVEEYHSMQFILLGRQPDRVDTGVVSAGFFQMLGVKPLLGRTFVPADEKKDAPPVLVLSYAYWQRAFGGDPHIVGKMFRMNDRLHEVVGVLPSIPQYPRENDVYMPTSACPFRMSEHHLTMRDMRMMQVFGHLKAGVPLASASAEMHTIGARFQHDYPQFYPAGDGFNVAVDTLRDQLTHRARPMLLMLLGISAMVLLICCTNVANLALARLVRREQEFAIRSALGASRARLTRQLLTESTLLAIAGGLLGVLICWFSLDLLARFIGRFTTRAGEITLNGPVLLFSLGISIATGLLFGSLPALAIRRGAAALKLGGGTMTSKVRGNNMRSGLIATEVALSFVLLCAAGLMIRSLDKLQRVDAGYHADHVLTAKLPTNWTKYNNTAKVRAFDDQVLQQIGNKPGVVAVGMTSAVPLDDSGPVSAKLFIEGRAVPPGHSPPQVDLTWVSPGAFQVLGIPLLRGRLLNDDDRPGKPMYVVINESMARHLWPGEDPIGKRISSDEKEWATIAGVVGDVRQFGLDKPAIDTAYVPMAVEPNGNRISIRTASDPLSMSNMLRTAIWSIDPEQPVSEIRTLDELRGESLMNTRVATSLLGLFATLALVIAATGLAGVTAFLVSQRTREIGIRLALGAQVGQVLGMIMGHGLKLIGVGAVGGVLLSMAATRTLRPLLFEVRPVDWPTMAGVALLLAAVATLASYLPARRATKVDPMVALRCD